MSVKVVWSEDSPIKLEHHPAPFVKIVLLVGATRNPVLLLAPKLQSIQVVYKASTLQNQAKSLPLSVNHVLLVSFLSTRIKFMSVTARAPPVDSPQKLV